MTELLRKAQVARAELDAAIVRSGGVIKETHFTGLIVDRLYVIEGEMIRDEPESHKEYCRLHG